MGSDGIANEINFFNSNLKNIHLFNNVINLNKQINIKNNILCSSTITITCKIWFLNTFGDIANNFISILYYNICNITLYDAKSSVILRKLSWFFKLKVTSKHIPKIWANNINVSLLPLSIILNTLWKHHLVIMLGLIHQFCTRSKRIFMY